MVTDLFRGFAAGVAAALDLFRDLPKRRFLVALLAINGAVLAGEMGLFVWIWSGVTDASWLGWLSRIGGTLVVLVGVPFCALTGIQLLLPLLADSFFWNGVDRHQPGLRRQLAANSHTGIVRTTMRALQRLLILTAGWLLAALVSLYPPFSPVAGILLLLYTGWWLTRELLDPYLDRLPPTSSMARRELIAALGWKMLGYGIPSGILMSLPIIGILFYAPLQTGIVRIVPTAPGREQEQSPTGS